MEIEVEYLISC